MSDVLGKKVIEGDFVIFASQRTMRTGRLEVGIIQNISNDKATVKTLRSLAEPSGETKLVARVFELDSERIAQCSALDISKPKREQLRSLLSVVK